MRVIYKLLIIAACCLPVQAFAIEKLSVSELLDRYAANQDKLKSFIVKTEKISTYLKQDASTQEERKRRYIEDLRYKDSDSDLIAYFSLKEFNLGEDGIWVPRESQSIYLWESKRYYQYHRTPIPDSSSLKIITSDEDYTNPKKGITILYSGADLMLGLLSGDIERFDSIFKQSNTISVRNELERVGSVDCYVIDAKSEHGTYTVWLDPEHGYGIAKAELHKGPEDLIHGRPPSSYKGMESYKGYSSFIENVRFKNIEGIWIHVKADIRTIEDRQDIAHSWHTHYKITQIDVNPDHDELQSFVLDVQNGTRIKIIDEPRFEYIWDDGKKFVVDEWDGSIRYVPKEWSILVGVGKPLPQLEGIKLNLSAKQTKDRAILLCFFDMNQRPSRYCVRQLAQKAAALKEKSIIVAAVQTSQVTEKTLNEWIKKYNIPFSVGAITEDIEKTRFAWGVRSLPWLILIDRKHIVRAEGFNIDELDERLGQITGTEPVMENNESTGPKLRTVRFPMSRSVGRLYVGELRLLDPHWWMGWQDAGPARGDVKVPADKALRLDVTKEGLKELSALAACKPDDIQVVSFDYVDVDDAGLGHLAGLTGLKMLVSPRVGDTGLAHISKLTSLISLTLRHGTFTDDGLKYISNLSSLQRLDLGYTEVTDAGLVHLRGLSSLRYLGLDYNKSVSDAGFVHLRSLNSLERMTLYGTNITGSGFSHLEGISSLREILLNHSAITNEGLGDIAKLKSLEKLSLFNTKISDFGIVHLQALGSLHELSLSGTSVSDAGLDYIGRLTSLESLDLPDWTTDAGLLKLKGLKGLKQLDLGRTQMTGIGLEPLKAFELLESLRLPRGVSDKDLAIIKEFTLLEELSIHNSPITDVGMGYLTALKSLRKLMLENVEVTDVGYAKLGELSNLEDLSILANRNRQEYAIGDQGLAGVAKLKGLKILYLRAPNLTDAGFKHLGKLRSLQEMELKEIKITDAGFVHIGRLRSLRRLWLPSSDICDAGLRHLAELNSLQDLSLQFSGGNTAGLLHLKSLRSLSQLIVSGVTFTEDSLQHLKEISPGLRSVHIGTGGISEEDAKRIEQQVPNCSIIVFAPLSIRRPLPPKPIPPHALVGKALPKFVGINIDFGPSQARDRMILICFFDMEQRPSRNCIIQLAKKTQELKANDVVIVAIHTSKVEAKTLNKWVMEKNISFPVGMVQGDEEKTRFTWGVRSLPWLILTDKQHVVTAEGFNPAELDEKLGKNSKH